MIHSIPVISYVNRYSRSNIVYLDFFFIYLIKEVEGVDEEVLKELVQDIKSKETGEKAMTLAQQLEARGKAEGRAEGEARGKLIGEIRTLEFVLQRPQTDEEILEQQSMEELIRQRDQLKQQVMQRQFPDA